MITKEINNLNLNITDNNKLINIVISQNRVLTNIISEIINKNNNDDNTNDRNKILLII